VSSVYSWSKKDIKKAAHPGGWAALEILLDRSLNQYYSRPPKVSAATHYANCPARISHSERRYKHCSLAQSMNSWPYSLTLSVQIDFLFQLPDRGRYG
jgi:hypothetical protein